jgi:THO complex subunit 2
VDTTDSNSDKMVIDTSRGDQVWQESLMPLIKSVKSILPESAWTKMSPHFYATFWQLSLYDIHIPRTRYRAEIDKQKAISVSRDLNARTATAEEIKIRMEEKKAARNLIQPLVDELEEQERHVAIVAKRLAREKDAWFANCMLLFINL